MALLPYIDQGSLYNEFHLDEPWDSEHNKKLLEKMPTTFAPADSQAFKDHETHYQAIVGKGTVFDGTKVGIVSIYDGTSKTILFVEAKKAVPWTKPEDFSLASDKLMSKLGDRVEGKFMAALCDGSVRFFPLAMKEETLRIWAIAQQRPSKARPGQVKRIHRRRQGPREISRNAYPLWALASCPIFGLFRFKVRTSGFSGLSTGAGSDSFPVRLAW